MTRLTIADIRAQRAAQYGRYRHLRPVEPDYLTAERFARVLGRLAAHLPLSDAYEAAVPQKTGRWWSSQREHMQAWFSQQGDTPARTTYNRLLCPTAFPWIAEALGEDPARVQAAIEACIAEPNIRRRPRIMREHLPWERIAELAEARTP